MEKFVGRSFIAALICAIVFLSISAFDLGGIYGDELIKEQSIKIEASKKEFLNEKEIFCKNNIVSQKNNWSLNSEKEIFINNDRYLEIKDCISRDSKVSILKLIKEYFKL